MIRILTVDDSKSMRQMIAFTLESAGIEVIEKSDGLEAYEWAKQNAAPDLILADINMPNMDGITLIKKLREMQEYKYIPILVLTTESSKEKKIQGKETGATGWIVKPFDPEQLINTINKVVGLKKQG
ncbi:response regulator [Candidatus Berkiella aquae]|uniref:Response regulator n=1 Tax=Candidatus Berkiella aquae TaxID=295108 RepID=A0A0Q9YP92_9GAMM|nr:response regulator [Candidatus Berkiella aquae]MCS5712012.1 response regulator [Candidatus Berkiella aquae]